MQGSTAISISYSLQRCAESDQPRMGDAHGQPGGSDGLTAVIMARKSTAPEKQAAVSSLHFEPVPEVQWRAVFRNCQIQRFPS